MKMRLGLSGRQVWRVVEEVSRVSRLCRSRVRIGAGPRVRTGLRADCGNVSAEFAMVTLAACGLAAGLYAVVTGSFVTGSLESVIKDALDGKR